MRAEWDRIRDFAEKCDDRVHEIRKGGFTLLSGLLTAGALFGGKFEASLQQGVGVPLALVVLAVLLAMRVAEKQNDIMLGAAAHRARSIEVLSTAELSEAIARRFEHEGWHRYTVLAYLLFGLAGVLVGMTTSPHLLAWVAIATLGVAYLVVLMKIQALGTGNPQRGADFFIGRVACCVREHVPLALVNLDSHAYEIGDPVAFIQLIFDEHGDKATPKAFPLRFPENAAGFKRFHIGPKEAFTWDWVPTEPGVYAIEVPKRDGVRPIREGRVLRKMIRVRPAASAPEPVVSNVIQVKGDS